MIKIRIRTGPCGYRFMADNKQSRVYGVGETIEWAIASFWYQFFETYLDLIVDEKKLGPGLKKTLSYIRKNLPKEMMEVKQ